MSELYDILHSNSHPLTEEKLVAYFEGKLSPQEQHTVEMWLAEEGLEADALEGLKTMSIDETRKITQQINHTLQTSLHKNKRRRHEYIRHDNWAWIAVIIILALSIMAYLALHYSILSNKH